MGLIVQLLVRNFIQIIAVILLSVSICCRAEDVIDLRLVPDSDFGSLDKCSNCLGIDNLKKTIDAIRVDPSRKDALIRIFISSGKYRIKKTIYLDGKSAENINFIGPKDKTAIFMGSLNLSEYTHSVERYSSLNGVDGNIFNLKLKKEFPIFDFSIPISGAGFARNPINNYSVFYKDKAMMLARDPNFGYAKIRPVGSNGGFTLFSGLGRSPSDYEGVFASGYFGRDWAYERIPIEKKSSEVFYLASNPKFGIKAGQRIRLENSLRFLDIPGEWFFSASDKSLYFYSPDAFDIEQLEVSYTSNLMVFSSAKNVKISGIKFVNSSADALVLKGANGFLISDSDFKNIGGRAVVISGVNSGLDSVLIENTGEGAVVLSGGNREKLRNSGLFIKNSEIKNFSRYGKTYRPALMLYGVGNYVYNNKIQGGEHSAIIFSGNDHLIEANEIYCTNLETSDAGAIYTGRSWSSRGTLIKNNYIHDIGVGNSLGNVMGIYLDDQVGGIDIYGNLFINSEQAVFIGGGSENRVVDNTFVRSNPAVHVDARGLTWQSAMAKSTSGPLFQSLKEIPWDSELFQKRYPMMKRMITENPGAPRLNLIANNHFISVEQKLRTMDGAEKYLEFHNDSSSSDVILNDYFLVWKNNKVNEIVDLSKKNACNQIVGN